MLTPWHEHSPALLLRFPKTERDVVDRLIACITDTGRRPLVIGISVKVAILYPYEHAARLGAATILDIAYGLVPEKPGLLLLITVCLDRILGSNTSAGNERNRGYRAYPRSS